MGDISLISSNNKYQGWSEFGFAVIKRQYEYSWIRQFCTFLSQDEYRGVPKDELRAHRRKFGKEAASRTRTGRVTKLAPG
jgi:hypothetical protein